MPSLIDYREEDACLLYLIRHGATAHNQMVPPRLQGAEINGPLSDLGRQQAGRVAAALAERPLAAVITSPLIRAAQTAEAIAGPHGLIPTEAPGLREVSVGRWEGRTWQDVQDADPEAYSRFRTDPHVHGYPGGENLRQVVERAEATLTPFLAAYIGREVVAVAHSVLNRCYLGSVLGLAPRLGHRLPQHNCSINIVRYRVDSPPGVKVLCFNAVGHLL